jgi:hypothetical protein
MKNFQHSSLFFGKDFLGSKKREREKTKKETKKIYVWRPNKRSGE